MPSDADMSGCSFVVYRGFLEFTGRQATKTEFALIWCSAIAGLDVNRSFVLARKGRSVPKNLEIVVANGVIRYHIVRRRIGSKNDEFESAGVMTLPVPRIVEEGLNELTLSSDGRQPSEIVNRLCTRFARDRAGAGADRGPFAGDQSSPVSAIWVARTRLCGCQRPRSAPTEGRQPLLSKTGSRGCRQILCNVRGRCA